MSQFLMFGFTQTSGIPDDVLGCEESMTFSDAFNHSVEALPTREFDRLMTRALRAVAKSIRNHPVAPPEPLIVNCPYGMVTVDYRLVPLANTGKRLLYLSFANHITVHAHRVAA